MEFSVDEDGGRLLWNPGRGAVAGVDSGFDERFVPIVRKPRAFGRAVRQADPKSRVRLDRIGRGKVADGECKLGGPMTDEALVFDIGNSFHDPEIALQADEVHVHIELDLGMRLAGEDEAHEYPSAAEKHRKRSRATGDPGGEFFEVREGHEREGRRWIFC